MTTVAYPPVALASSSSSIISAAGPSILAFNPSTSTVVSPPSSTSTSSNAGKNQQQGSIIRLVAVTEDGKIAASIGDDKSLKVWDIKDDAITLRSTRAMVKKGSHITFGPDQSIVVCDKVGDAYLYPLDPVPADPSTSRPPMYTLVSDPTKNPDCTYLLGHTSILNSHVVTSDGKSIITADRDEHIRISRFPKSYVVEKYLFGHEGFVSALHIPSTHPSTLISGGGDASLRIWDHTTGNLVSKVDIYPAVLPHRRVRASMRKNRFLRKVTEQAPSESNQAAETTTSASADEETFYTAPEGWILPSGQGVCVRKIESVRVGDDTVVLFFSEGAAALHSFILSPDSTPSAVHTIPFPYPILDFTPISTQPGQVLVSLDTAWGVLKKNPSPGTEGRQDVIPRDDLSDEEQKALEEVFTVVSVGAGGSLNKADSAIAQPLSANLPKTNIKTVSNLDLYPLLNMLPRWPGHDEELDEANLPSTPGGDASSIAPSSMTSATNGLRRNYAPEELEKMGTKQLGRLKSSGVDIGNLLVQRQKKAKEENRRKLGLDKQMPPPPKKVKKEKKQLNEEDMANA
ncbi:hypothetical protein I316_02271 [Kwoniella heveanensis BCC8398]|uniref:Uncharacterized protein n=1 Tax=Kwoniella heveanensis BCC8398 TaxID=1296120 RepID=A0A1B9GXN8_9TREE|nr:hypothetical protein I316_02271 [Kwoniella heveanensis BCC8398]